MSEIWRPVVGFTGYEISNLSRVRRLAIAMPANIAARCGHVDLMMRPHIKREGYVGLRLTRDGVKVDCLVHTLVATAFHGPCPEGYECRHLNGNKQDNRVENLRWGSRRENVEDNFRLEVYPRGEDHKKSKLTEERVREARVRYAAGESFSSIGRDYDTNYSTIMRAVTGESWSHIPGAIASRCPARAARR